jgi:Lrp/AsnC family transcriptional regulator for asnA, asnC and gidA
MNLAYVLINTEMGSEEKVTNDLKKVEEVKEVHQIYGVYDLIVRVETETLEKLKTVISDSIRTLENVRSTLTMIVMD